jgi:hypothetical protein
VVGLADGQSPPPAFVPGVSPIRPVRTAVKGLTAIDLWPRNLTKPRCETGIPNYAYRGSSTLSNPASALSEAGVLMEMLDRPPVAPARAADGSTVLLPAGPELKIRYFQLVQPWIVIDHCALSRVAVTLENDGGYGIAFRADQNPRPGSGLGVELPKLEPGERVRYTEYLKRNEFVVRIRGYGAYPLRDERPALAPGKPVLLEFDITPFMVQRGEPYQYFSRGSDERVARYFRYVERIEVEFQYRN